VAAGAIPASSAAAASAAVASTAVVAATSSATPARVRKLGRDLADGLLDLVHGLRIRMGSLGIDSLRAVGRFDHNANVSHENVLPLPFALVSFDVFVKG
jgi:hypothetical protein